MPPVATTAATQATTAECIECGCRFEVNVSIAGELIDCPDCGLELEVRSLAPLVLAAAPEVEEDWGE